MPRSNYCHWHAACNNTISCKAVTVTTKTSGTSRCLSLKMSNSVGLAGTCPWWGSILTRTPSATEWCQRIRVPLQPNLLGRCEDRTPPEHTSRSHRYSRVQPNLSSYILLAHRPSFQLGLSATWRLHGISRESHGIARTSGCEPRIARALYRDTPHLRRAEEPAPGPKGSDSEKLGESQTLPSESALSPGPDTERSVANRHESCPDARPYICDDRHPKGGAKGPEWTVTESNRLRIRLQPGSQMWKQLAWRSRRLSWLLRLWHFQPDDIMLDSFCSYKQAGNTSETAEPLHSKCVG